MELACVLHVVSSVYRDVSPVAVAGYRILSEGDLQFLFVAGSDPCCLGGLPDLPGLPASS